MVENQSITVRDITLDEKPFASGGFGKIYKGTLKRGDESITVAVKQIAINPRIQDELSALEHLSQPVVVKYYGSYYNNGLYYLVMEYCKYGSLRDYMKTTKRQMHDLSAFHVLRQLTSVVGYLHSQQIVHRDISPGNILISRKEQVDGYEKLQIKLCDFGLSKQLAPGKQLKTIVGTPGYMAPDMVTAYNRAVDVYSMGCVLYFMLSGIEPRDRRITSADLERVFNPSARRLIQGMIASEQERIELKAIGLSDFCRECSAKISNNGPNSWSSRQHEHANSGFRGSQEFRQREENAPRSRRRSVEALRATCRDPSVESRLRRYQGPKESGYISAQSDQHQTRNQTRSTSTRLFETRREPSRSCVSEGCVPIAQKKPTTSTTVTDNSKIKWPLSFEQFDGMAIISKEARYSVQGPHFIREALNDGRVTGVMIVTIGNDKGQKVSFYQPISNEQIIRSLSDPRAKYDKKTLGDFYNLEDLSGLQYENYRRSFLSLQVFTTRSAVVVVCLHPAEFPDGKAEILQNGDRRVVLLSGSILYGRCGSGTIEDRSFGRIKIVNDGRIKESFFHLFRELDAIAKLTTMPLPPLKIAGACDKNDCKWCNSEKGQTRKEECRPISTAPSSLMNFQEHQARPIANKNRVPLREMSTNKNRDEEQMEVITKSTPAGEVPIAVWGKKTLRKSTNSDYYVYKAEDNIERRFNYGGDLNKITDPDIVKMLRYLLRRVEEGI
ncbi:unnamed protein product, partial [Mesorhabditis belari]|uniref:Protein kinase domain-containing protein n=1 Tax=Mesorhabditis belari TaxID=2138241 RepID=A0AAF3FHL3_9BILA